MKQIYVILLLVFSLMLSAQDMANVHNIKTAKTPSFKLYPNPAFDDVVYVTTEKNRNKDIIVYDVFGEVVLRDRISSSALNISKLVPGVYVLQVTEDNQSMTRKLVVK